MLLAGFVVGIRSNFLIKSLALSGWLCLYDVEISVFFLPKVDPLVSCAFTFLSAGGCWRPVSIGIERGNYRSFKTEVVQLKGN